MLKNSKNQDSSSFFKNLLKNVSLKFKLFSIPFISISIIVFLSIVMFIKFMELNKDKELNNQLSVLISEISRLEFQELDYNDQAYIDIVNQTLGKLYTVAQNINKSLEQSYDKQNRDIIVDVVQSIDVLQTTLTQIINANEKISTELNKLQSLIDDISFFFNRFNIFVKKEQIIVENEIQGLEKDYNLLLDKIKDENTSIVDIELTALNNINSNNSNDELVVISDPFNGYTETIVNIPQVPFYSLLSERNRYKLERELENLDRQLQKKKAELKELSETIPSTIKEVSQIVNSLQDEFSQLETTNTLTGFILIAKNTIAQIELVLQNENSVFNNKYKNKILDDISKANVSLSKLQQLDNKVTAFKEEQRNKKEDIIQYVNKFILQERGLVNRFVENFELYTVIFLIISISLILYIYFLILAYIRQELEDIEHNVNKIFSIVEHKADDSQFIIKNSQDRFGRLSNIIANKGKELKSSIETDRAFIDDFNSLFDRLDRGFINFTIEATPSNYQLIIIKNRVNKFISLLHNYINLVNITVKELTRNNFSNDIQNVDNISGSLGTLIDLLQVLNIKNREMFTRVIVHNRNFLNLSQEISIDLKILEKLISKQNDVSITTKNIFDTTEKNMEHIIDDIKNVEMLSSSMNNLMNIILNISEQTNLVSINAAIEASRTTGRTGDGFRVIADDIRQVATDIESSLGEMEQFINKLLQGVGVVANKVNKEAINLRKISRTVNNINEYNWRSLELINNINSINNKSYLFAKDLNIISSNIIIPLKAESEEEVCNTQLILDTSLQLLEILDIRDKNLERLSKEDNSWDIQDKGTSGLYIWMKRNRKLSYALNNDWREALTSIEEIYDGVQTIINQEFSEKNGITNYSQEVEETFKQLIDYLNKIKWRICRYTKHTALQEEEIQDMNKEAIKEICKEINSDEVDEADSQI